jgi:hypothetical protein
MPPVRIATETWPGPAILFGTTAATSEAGFCDTATSCPEAEHDQVSSKPRIASDPARAILRKLATGLGWCKRFESTRLEVLTTATQINGGVIQTPPLIGTTRLRFNNSQRPCFARACSNLHDHSRSSTTLLHSALRPRRMHTHNRTNRGFLILSLIGGFQFAARVT